MISDYFRPEDKIVPAFGLSFKNPVGLAAGFDKNAQYLSELESLGFGFVEIGTVTPLPQEGNFKPRLFRLKKDQALINRMGFNNVGAIKIAENLKEWKFRASQNLPPATTESRARFLEPHLPMLIGGNIGKNKQTPNEEAWKDYEICFHRLFDVVDYFVVNVSSPNTPGLRELQEKDSLRKILSNLQSINLAQAMPKPLLFKIAPDLSREQIDDVIDLAMELNLSGIVATNTTISRDNLLTEHFKVESMGTGGLSGKPLRERSTEIIQYITEKTNRRIAIIGSGGIFDGDDAKEKLNAGALLIQVWTGFIYEGPGIAKKISSKL